MSNHKTITQQTPHGEVEYETVECDSCGSEVMANEAVDFNIGEREGKACQHCAEVGPIDFPGATHGGWGWFLAATLCFPLPLLMAITGDHNWGSGQSENYLAGVAGTLLWTILTILMVGLV